jgi:hypothetical protein
MKKNRFFLMKKVGAILFSVISIIPFFISGSVIIYPSPVYAQASTLPACTTGYKQDVSGDTLLGTYTQADGVTACSIANTDPQLVAQNNAKSLNGAGPTSCGGFLQSLASPFTCGLRWFIAVMSAAIISFDVWLLAVVSAFFNLLVVNTITQFSTFYQSIQGPILTVWDAFRDISNILIIGLFVFIAICTILGIKEYGYKKLVARVLIIAVLINFSLLFTKIVLDASNFTATVFYNASLPQPATGTATTSGVNPANGFATDGIAGRFVGLLGVSGFADTISAVEASGDNNDSIIAELLSAGGAAIMLVGATIVLLYGCFILSVRAILLIVLLISSALAFATYLSPKFSSYGWDKWWNSLFKTAVLAPILMILLWATLNIATQLPQSGGTLGKLATLQNATNNSEILALFNYAIILGLLFASFKISSSFASDLGLGKVVSAIGSYATGGLSGIGAFAGRNTISRLGLGMANSRATTANNARNAQERALREADNHTKAGDTAMAGIAKAEAERQRKIAAKNIISAGRWNGLADAKFGGKTGLKSKIDAQGAAGAKLADKIKPDEKAKNAVRDEASKQVMDSREGERKNIESEQKNSSAALDEIKKATDEQTKTLSGAVQELAEAERAALDKKSSTQGDHDAALAKYAEKIAEKTVSGAPEKEVEDLKLQRQKLVSARQAEFQSEDDRINKARVAVADIQPKVNLGNQKFQEALAQNEVIKKRLSEFNAQTEKMAKTAGDGAIKRLSNSASQIAGEVAVRQGGFVNRTVGAVTGDNDKIRHAAIHKFGHSKEASLRKAMKDFESDDHGGGDSEKKGGGGDDHH